MSLFCWLARGDVVFVLARGLVLAFRAIPALRPCPFLMSECGFLTSLLASFFLSCQWHGLLLYLGWPLSAPG